MISVEIFDESLRSEITCLHMSASDWQIAEQGSRRPGVKTSGLVESR